MNFIISNIIDRMDGNIGIIRLNEALVPLDKAMELIDHED